jgi:hypothetical protein
VLAVAAFCWLARWGGTRDAASAVLSVAALALFGVVLAQRKGWWYHHYPSYATALAALAALAAATSRAVATRWGGRIADRLGLAVLALLLLRPAVEPIDRVLRPTAYRRNATNQLITRVTNLVRRRAHGGSFAVLYGDLLPAFPAANDAHARWALRFPSLLFLSALYRGETRPGETVRFHSGAALGATERRLRDMVVDDLLRERPALLFVDAAEDKIAFGGARFDYLAYFSQDPRFAQLGNEYALVGNVFTFRVYERRPPRQGAAR